MWSNSVTFDSGVTQQLIIIDGSPEIDTSDVPPFKANVSHELMIIHCRPFHCRDVIKKCL